MKKVFLILLFVLASCGSKQKTVHDEEVVLQLQQKEVVKTDSEIKADVAIKVNVKESVQTTTTSTKKTFTPVDPTKPSSVTDKNGNTTVLNNASLVEEESNGTAKSDKETDASQTDKTQKSDKSNSKSELTLNASEAKHNMNLNKKGSPDWWWLWVLLLFVCIIAGLWLYRKFNLKSYVTRFFNK